MIRQMRTTDIAGAMYLKEAAHWNQTEADWLRLLRLEPEGCFVDDREGVLAGTTTALRHGNDLAWIGMVLVLPEFRRRGIARGLMEHAMKWLRDRDIGTTRLDATDMGLPLYRELGFQDEELIERWERLPSPPTRQPGAKTRSASWGDALAALDRSACGYDRSALMHDLAADASVDGVQSASGFAFGRPGSRAWFLGPCVASSESEAESLLASLLAGRDSQHAYWDLLPANPAAPRLAARFGFRPARRLVRMVHEASGGTAERVPPDRVVATAGFEFG